MHEEHAAEEEEELEEGDGQGGRKAEGMEGGRAGGRGGKGGGEEGDEEEDEEEEACSLAKPPRWLCGTQEASWHRRSRHCGFKKPRGTDGAATAASRSLVASGFTRGTAAATAAHSGPPLRCSLGVRGKSRSPWRLRAQIREE